MFRAVDRCHRVAGEALTPQTIRNVVAEHAAAAGLGRLAPHDLASPLQIQLQQPLQNLLIP